MFRDTLNRFRDLQEAMTPQQRLANADLNDKRAARVGAIQTNEAPGSFADTRVKALQGRLASRAAFQRAKGNAAALGRKPDAARGGAFDGIKQAYKTYSTASREARYGAKDPKKTPAQPQDLTKMLDKAAWIRKSFR